MKYVLISGTAILRSKIADINSGAWFSFCTTKLAEFDQGDVAHTKVENNDLLMFYFNVPDSEWPMIKIHSGSVETECDICEILIPYERDYGSPSWPLCKDCYGRVDHQTHQKHTKLQKIIDKLGEATK